MARRSNGSCEVPVVRSNFMEGNPVSWKDIGPFGTSYYSTGLRGNSMVFMRLTYFYQYSRRELLPGQPNT
jgi:hypothetical protein